VIGGGHVGYNLQYNRWLVLGIEGSVDGTSLSHTVAVPVNDVFGDTPGSITARSEVNVQGSVRGRIGIAFKTFDMWMACHAQEEIAEACGCGQGGGAEPEVEIGPVVSPADKQVDEAGGSAYEGLVFHICFSRPGNRRFLARIGASSGRRQVEDRASLGSRGG
jgi:hypothetical protein